MNRPRAADLLRDHTLPYGGATPGPRAGAGSSKRFVAGTPAALHEIRIRVPASDQRSARTGPTIWSDAQVRLKRALLISAQASP
jgi:hypothetical protein